MDTTFLNSDTVSKLRFVLWLIKNNKMETWYNWEEVEKINPCQLNEETYLSNTDKTKIRSR